MSNLLTTRRYNNNIIIVNDYNIIVCFALIFQLLDFFHISQCLLYNSVADFKLTSDRHV